MSMDNHKLVTILDFVLKYEKDAIFFFTKNMIEKLWNPTVCMKQFFFTNIM